MEMRIQFLVIICLISVDVITPQLSNNRDELLNWCIRSRNHKGKPGKEDYLHKQCLPWKSRSCCTYNTTRNLHIGKSYNFDFNHCKRTTNKQMSENCMKHFRQDLCFYECSPNQGPWVVKQKKTFREERFVGVPLCMSDCVSWWNACRDDYTCTNNWARNFKWKNMVNVCPYNAVCQKFSKIYSNAADFCETVWDGSWKVVSDDKTCMRIWFNSTLGNPNDRVAELRVDELLGPASSSTYFGVHISVMFTTMLISILLFYV
ncbi:FOLR1 (predicted) [Pycnogonum litorale]